MRLLFEIDTKDYSPDAPRFVRPSVRAIIIKDGLVAMIYSQKYHYYKFPGGGIEAGEDHLSALIREAREEAGVVIIPETVREYGYVHRQQKGKCDDIFVQDNFYYLCEVTDETLSQQLDPYEADEQFTPEFVLPETAIAVNRGADHGDRSNEPQLLVMAQREARVLELLMEEGIVSSESGA